MASSIVAICNRGLNMIGQEPILALTEQNEAGRTCNLIWDSIRDEVLRVFPWRCVTKRTTLARLAETPPSASGFSYYYQLPTDFIRMIGMDYSDRIYDIDGDKLLSNDETAYIKYVKRETDPNKYDSILISCLAIRIGVELAYKIAGSRTLARELMDTYLKMVGLGASIDSQEGMGQQIEADDWTDVHES